MKGVWSVLQVRCSTERKPHFNFQPFITLNFPGASSTPVNTFFTQQQCPAPSCQGGAARGGIGHLQSHAPAQISGATQLLPSTRGTEITIIWNKQLPKQSVSKHYLLSALLRGSKQSLFTPSPQTTGSPWSRFARRQE